MATNWINDLLGKTVITNAGGQLPDRKFLQFINGTVVDDPATGRTVVDLSSGGGGGAGWPTVLGIDPTSGANSPSIDAGQHLNFNEVDIRTTQFGSTVFESDAVAGELRATTGHRLTGSESGVGIGTSIETGASSRGVRADNPQLAVAFQPQRSPALSLRGSGWFTDTAAAYQVLWGFQVRPSGNTTSTALDVGGLTVRTALSGAGEFDVARFEANAGGASRWFAILSSVGAIAASSGRGLRVGDDFQATARNDVSGDTRWFEFNSGLFGADDVLMGYTAGGTGLFGIVADLNGTPVPRLLQTDFDFVLFASDGVNPIAQINDDAAVFTGPDGVNWSGIIDLDPSTNPIGEAVSIEATGTTIGVSTINETQATAGVQQFSRYIAWSNEQWDSDAAVSYPNTWGFQLRAPAHDHSVLPDPYGALVLRANHRDLTQLDVFEIRHELDPGDFAHTFIGPTDGDSNFVLTMHGRNAVSAATPGRNLEIYGGDGQTTGVGGSVILGSGASPGGTEGNVLAVKRHPTAEVISLADEVALGAVNLVAATAGTDQFSPMLAWSGSAWQSFIFAPRQTTWATQLRTFAFDETVLIDFGALAFRAQSAVTERDVLLMRAQETSGGTWVTLLYREADDQGIIGLRGTDAIAADTDAGGSVLQGGVAQGTGRGGRASVTGGPTTGAGEFGDATIDGHNVLMQSGAGVGVNGGMVGGVIVDTATTVPTANPAAGRAYIFLDPADDRMRYRDSSGVFRLW